jgi:hypothetical protein
LSEDWRRLLYPEMPTRYNSLDANASNVKYYGECVCLYVCVCVALLEGWRGRKGLCHGLVVSCVMMVYSMQLDSFDYMFYNHHHFFPTIAKKKKKQKSGFQRLFDPQTASTRR